MIWVERVTRDIIKVDCYNREVVARVASFHDCFIDLIVHKTDRDLCRVLNYVIIRTDQKLFIALSDDNSGADAFTLDLVAAAIPAAESIVESIGTKHILYFLNGPVRDRYDAALPRPPHPLRL